MTLLRGYSFSGTHTDTPDTLSVYTSLSPVLVAAHVIGWCADGLGVVVGVVVEVVEAESVSGMVDGASHSGEEADLGSCLHLKSAPASQKPAQPV